LVEINNLLLEVAKNIIKKKLNKILARFEPLVLKIPNFHAANSIEMKEIKSAKLV
jgi:hypothetical protein